MIKVGDRVRCNWHTEGYHMTVVVVLKNTRNLRACVVLYEVGTVLCFSNDLLVKYEI